MVFCLLSVFFDLLFSNFFHAEKPLFLGEMWPQDAVQKHGSCGEHLCDTVDAPTTTMGYIKPYE